MATSTLGTACKAKENSSSLKKKGKRIVKHKKRAWRVTSDVSDVERFLESKRLDERLGAPLEERPSDTLFIVDTKAEVEKPVKNVIGKRHKLTKIGPLKCYANLTPSSAVQDPLVKRNRVRTPAERADPLVIDILAKKRANGQVPQRFIQSMKDSQSYAEKLAKKKSSSKLRTTFDFDLWGEQGESLVVKEKTLAHVDLSDELKRYTLEKTGKRIYTRPQTMFAKTTALPAVEVPHPGASYNPTFEDHQDLLTKAAITEIEEIMKETKLKRKVAPIMAKIDPQEKQERWMTEMSQGLADDDESEKEEPEAPVPRLPKPKTEKQKKKAKKLKLREIQQNKLKEKKKRMQQLDQLKSIGRQIRASEELQAKRAEKRKKQKEAKLLKPADLGRYKYEAPPLEVNLSEDISGSLRTLKSEGNVLIDRYKSLQRRNMVEPRVRQRVVLKYKHKVFTKRSHMEPKGVKVGKKPDAELPNDDTSL